MISDRAIEIQFRGQPVEIEYVASGDGQQISWWFVVSPGLKVATEYELRAIDAICARDFADRRAEWIARKLARRIEPKRRRLSPGGDAA